MKPRLILLTAVIACYFQNSQAEEYKLKSGEIVGESIFSLNKNGVIFRKKEGGLSQIYPFRYVDTSNFSAEYSKKIEEYSAEASKEQMARQEWLRSLMSQARDEGIYKPEIYKPEDLKELIDEKRRERAAKEYELAEMERRKKAMQNASVVKHRVLSYFPEKIFNPQTEYAKQDFIKIESIKFTRITEDYIEYHPEVKFVLPGENAKGIYKAIANQRYAQEKSKYIGFAAYDSDGDTFSRYVGEKSLIGDVLFKANRQTKFNVIGFPFRLYNSSHEIGVIVTKIEVLDN